MKYLTAILNSKLVAFWLKNSSCKKLFGLWNHGSGNFSLFCANYTAAKLRKASIECREYFDPDVEQT